jgi:hypothetical protein
LNKDIDFGIVIEPKEEKWRFLLESKMDLSNFLCSINFKKNHEEQCYESSLRPQNQLNNEWTNVLFIFIQEAVACLTLMNTLCSCFNWIFCDLLKSMNQYYKYFLHILIYLHRTYLLEQKIFIISYSLLLTVICLNNFE